jgi:mannonate dehydratase
MKETWRWFGESDPITLEHVRQTGASGVVTALHQIPDGTAWPAEEIAKRKGMIEAAGLEWSVCESIPMEQSVKRGDGYARPSRPRWRSRRLLQFHACRGLDAHEPTLAGT